MTEEKTNWWDGITIENFDWRYSDPLSNAFVDLLLLAIIRVHPMQADGKQTELERLRDAKRAVFGIKPRDDLKESRDFPLLVEMAQEYISDRGGGKYIYEERRFEWGDHDEDACRNIKPLARDVVRCLKKRGAELNPMVEEESVVARLARKFRVHQDDLIVQVVMHGNLETDYMVGWIEQAKELFGPFSIPLADAQDPVRDLKYLF